MNDMNAIEEFKGLFKKKFKIDFPLEIPAGVEVLEKNKDGEPITIATVAGKAAYNLQSQISQFLEKAPVGYFFAGFWGHGINSYAFYYCKVTDREKVFFRLPYGGAYGDERDAEDVREKLTAFAKFEKVIKNKAKELVLVDSMGERFGKITGNNGKVAESPDLEELTRAVE